MEWSETYHPPPLWPARGAGRAPTAPVLHGVPLSSMAIAQNSRPGLFLSACALCLHLSPFSLASITFWCYFLPLSFSSPSLPLSSLSPPPPPLHCPHQRCDGGARCCSSLGWHREQADTWEGCFVILQVVPPWQREGGRGQGEGRTPAGAILLPSNHIPFAASPSVCVADGLSLFSHRRREVSPCYILPCALRL